MPLPTLLVPPDQANYSALEGHTVVSTQLDGGASRFRADQLGGVFKVKVQWTLSDFNFTYLKAFYRNAVSFGSLPFNISLLLDNNAMNSYVAYFLPDTLELVSQSGLTYIVRAELEVIPNSAYYASDAAIVAAGPTF